jgi:hypothetical protein
MLLSSITQIHFRLQRFRAAPTWCVRLAFALFNLQGTDAAAQRRALLIYHPAFPLSSTIFAFFKKTCKAGPGVYNTFI